MTVSNSVYALLLLCAGVFGYASAYAVKSYAVPSMSASSLMFVSGLTIFAVSIFMKIITIGLNAPWFEFDPGRRIAVQVIGMVAFSVLLAGGDLLYLSGMNFPEVSPTMATCVFALIPIFEGAIAIFRKQKAMNIGQLIACAMIVGGIVIYAIYDEGAKK